MAGTSRRVSVAWKKLHAKALSLPEACEDFPWGDCVAKVNKKVFVFLGDGTADAKVSLKLRAEAHEHALSIEGAAPTGYNLGRAGWVTLPVKEIPGALLEDWLLESYALVAPKRLSQSLGTKPK